MGFTLGLPPGFYAPDKPEIRELVEKIRQFNGIILPSSLSSTQEQQQAQKKTVVVGNLPINISEEEIIRTITQELLRRKLIIDQDPIESCEIPNSRYIALLHMKTPKDAQAAVKMGSVIYRGYALRISWANVNISADKNVMVANSGGTITDIAGQSVTPSDKLENFDKANTLDSLFVDATIPLPDVESIKAAFDQTFPVENIYKPEGFNHCIINLVDTGNIDLAVMKLNDIIVNGVKLRVRRTFLAEGEGPLLLDQNEKIKMRKAAGVSNLLTVLSPLLRQNACVADILNIDVPIAVVEHVETERIQESTGRTLLLYNIAQPMVLVDPESCNELTSDIREECINYGKVLEVLIAPIPTMASLPSDYAVVKVVFEDPEDAKAAQIALSGRRYAGRLVITQLIQ